MYYKTACESRSSFSYLPSKCLYFSQNSTDFILKIDVSLDEWNGKRLQHYVQFSLLSVL